jgi:hypothetical protein
MNVGDDVLISLLFLYSTLYLISPAQRPDAYRELTNDVHYSNACERNVRLEGRMRSTLEEVEVRKGVESRME